MDPGIQYRTCGEPRGGYPATTIARAPNSSQHVSHGSLRPIELRQVTDREGALAAAAWRQAIDRQAEARKMVERAGQYRGALPASGCVGG